MSRKPYDLTEWLQFLWLSKDLRLAEFALELQQMVDENCTEEYWELCDEIENLTEKRFPNNEPRQALKEIESDLSALDDYREKRLERATRVVELLPKPLEYDL